MTTTDSATATCASLAPRRSLYDLLGGRAAVAAAVDGLYTRLLADTETARFFEGMDVLRLSGHLRLFLGAALGGPGLDPLPDLRAAHAGLGITDDDFDRVAGHLAAVLSGLGVEGGLSAQVLEVVGPLRSLVVAVPRG